ncbi:MAG: ArsC/Spx/MgsR family protein [Putridiphycobacter sp.]|nr:ArsC/Spx/MgsR family protein [Putridiphycobacter sp.]
MIKLFHLSTCSTCQRIIKELNLPESAVLQDIKQKNVNEKDIEAMKAAVGSYEALFSKRAMKFRAQGLHEQELSEADYKRLILEEYTFLKRPVLFVNEQVFVGNSKKVVASAKAVIQQVS